MIILIILWLCSAFLCYALAKDKNKDQGTAFVMGLLFGIFAIIYYAVCKSEPPTK